MINQSLEICSFLRSVGLDSYGVMLRFGEALRILSQTNLLMSLLRTICHFFLAQQGAQVSVPSVMVLLIVRAWYVRIQVYTSIMVPVYKLALLKQLTLQVIKFLLLQDISALKNAPQQLFLTFIIIICIMGVFLVLPVFLVVNNVQQILLRIVNNVIH